MKREQKGKALAFFIIFAVLLNWPVLRIFEGAGTVLGIPVSIFFITLLWVLTIMAAYSLSRRKE